MTKYEKASAAVKHYVATHSPQQLVELAKQAAPYAFQPDDQPKREKAPSPRTTKRSAK